MNLVPEDVICHISEFLPLLGFINLSSCSINLNVTLSKYDSYWRTKCTKDYHKSINSTCMTWKEFYILNYTCIYPLFVFCEEVMSYNKQNTVQSYHSIYNFKHFERFKEVYRLCRPQFIKDMPLKDFINWFKNVPEQGFCLSIIFRKCSKIATDIETEADKYFFRPEEILNNPAAVYPERFILYLFRIFYYCADKIDRKTLIQPRIEELENMLGIRKRKDIPYDFLLDVD